MLLILLTMGECSQPKGSHIADVVTIKEYCLGAKDEASFVRMNEITREGGCKGLDELVFADKVFPLEEGDKVEVIRTSAGKTRIKCKDGELWVASDFQKKKSITQKDANN